MLHGELGTLVLCAARLDPLRILCTWLQSKWIIIKKKGFTESKVSTNAWFHFEKKIIETCPAFVVITLQFFDIAKSCLCSVSYVSWGYGVTASRGYGVNVSDTTHCMGWILPWSRPRRRRYYKCLTLEQLSSTWTSKYIPCNETLAVTPTNHGTRNTR